MQEINLKCPEVLISLISLSQYKDDLLEFLQRYKSSKESKSVCTLLKRELVEELSRFIEHRVDQNRSVCPMDQIKMEYLVSESVCLEIVCIHSCI